MTPVVGFGDPEIATLPFEVAVAAAWGVPGTVREKIHARTPHDTKTARVVLAVSPTFVKGLVEQFLLVVPPQRTRVQEGLCKPFIELKIILSLFIFPYDIYVFP